MLLARKNSLCFTPSIQRSLSAGEVDAYHLMIEGKLSPDPELTSGISVVVVGAGLAGLSSARELRKAGMDVTILESTDRVGGRCYTMSTPTFDEGIHAEAGGMRFPSSHKVMTKYVGK